MTTARLVMLLRDRMHHPDAGEGSVVQLRHDRELFVFNRDGQMVGESIVLVRGPVQDTATLIANAAAMEDPPVCYYRGIT